MLQIKDRKGRHLNTGKKMKAAPTKRRLHFDSKIIGKSQNFAMDIINPNRKISTNFFGQIVERGESNG